MSVTRYDFFDGVGEAAVDSEGSFVAYDDYASLAEKLRAAWQEHFLLSKERSKLQIEVAMLKALLEPRVWQD